MSTDCKEGGGTAIRMPSSGAGRMFIMALQQPHWVLASYLGNDEAGLRNFQGSFPSPTYSMSMILPNISNHVSSSINQNFLAFVFVQGLL